MNIDLRYVSYVFYVDYDTIDFRLQAQSQKYFIFYMFCNNEFLCEVRINKFENSLKNSNFTNIFKKFIKDYDGQQSIYII